jgi:hypothetical protein
LTQSRASAREIERIYDILDTKANFSFVNDEFDVRPTKELMNTYLAHKASVSDVESHLARKVDNSEFSALQDLVDSKTDISTT